MARIATTALLLSVVVAPAVYGSSFSSDNDRAVLARRQASDELVSRRLHIHLPKVHLPHIKLPHISGKQFLNGLKKFGPKIGKTVFKIAKLALREDIEETHLVARDIDGAEALYELLARSPRISLKNMMKSVKKMKKYVKTGANLAHSVGLLRRGMGDDWEAEIVERALDELDVLDARDLYAHLTLLERAIVAVDNEKREWNMGERGWAREDQEVHARDDTSDTHFARHYSDYGLEDLD
ncbi:hypothetical protein JR316_0006371 [Psilocybe cubensis]|uniref:Uncharacterized protein n=2 Tax=Psilocybe cubensis TaxID=181762 RepID=A0A8H7XNH9_PSICU|nr:hypothetical protein JR316_0006371 [Psilocybe cubensis]KAH9481841.1 hypothetical protein JR316_0006371 [Psilocybe cubensis]